MTARERVLSGMRPIGRQRAATGCRTAGIGCLDCKAMLLDHLMPTLDGIRERRTEFAGCPGRLREVLHEGSARARATARDTLAEAKAAVGVV